MLNLIQIESVITLSKQICHGLITRISKFFWSSYSWKYLTERIVFQRLMHLKHLKLSILIRIFNVKYVNYLKLLKSALLSWVFIKNSSTAELNNSVQQHLLSIKEYIFSSLSPPHSWLRKIMEEKCKSQFCLLTLSKLTAELLFI